MAAPPLTKVPAATQVRVSKFIWRALMVFNFGVGAYIFAMPKKKQTLERKINAAEAPSVPTGNSSEDSTLHSSTAPASRLQQSFLEGEHFDHSQRLVEEKSETPKS